MLRSEQKLFQNLKKINKDQYFNLFKKKGNFNLYPSEIFDKIKRGDILNVGFEELVGKVVSKSNNLAKLRCVQSGILENNKGIHIENRNVKINYITHKDNEAIKIGKNLIYKIIHYLLQTHSKI